ncbi:hypothetical protein PMZ80_000042 [Knufia obscura]|uniref:Uncharacterized protein n=2 Tax=Knufia TaxID=430999 RepID=A0AAN8EEH6_9EURO|nr:hypothetical protein PMZ80_000042 [Knufia obscura]KAK5948777.1 hypothetical protein OHC33_010200 [Knufia fluminis]
MSSKSSAKASSSHSSHRYHRHHKHHKSASRPLLILHLLNGVFSFISIAVYAAILPVWNANFFHSTGIVRGDWPDALPILPLFITFVASLFYLTKRCIARRNTKKPGDYLQSRNKPTSSSAQCSRFQVYLTFTTLILLLTFLILAGIAGLYRFWRPAVITSSVELSSGTASSSISLSTLSLRRSLSDSSPTSLIPPTDGSPTSTSSQNVQPKVHSCSLANVFTRRCNPTLYLIGDLQIAAIATSSLVWLINLSLIVLQAREYQYQKHKHQRSLRAKAKAKFDFVEDEISKAEKGEYVTKKKIHHDKRKGHSKSPSDPSLVSQQASNISPPPLTRPKRARTVPSHGDNAASVHPTVRPKQHYYNPDITPSRSRTVREAQPDAAANLAPAPLQTSYSRAVEEARRKVKPAETMRDWMDRRYS